MSHPADVAVVTGASGGIGRWIARELSSICGTTFLVGRDKKRLRETAADCEGTTHVVVANVTEAPSLQSIADDLAGTGQTRIVLVAGAGVIGPIIQPGREDPSEWATTIQTNLIGAYYSAFSFLPIMQDAGWGRVVMVSSAQSLHGPDPLMSAYATSKIALNAYAACLAANFAGTGLSACAIHPGDVFTNMGEEIRSKALEAGPSAAHLADWAERTAEHGGDDPREAGDLVKAIVEHDAGWSNGRFLLVPSSIERHPKVPWAIGVGPVD